MKKLIKGNDGVALVMIIIVTTCIMVVMTTLLNLSYHNYLLIKSHGNKNASYYVADYGAEKVIKNIETVVESAKIYASEMVRTDTSLDNSALTLKAAGESITPYEYFIKYSTTGTPTDVAAKDFIAVYERYYNSYIKNDDNSVSKGGIYSTETLTPVKIENESSLPGAEYTADITEYNNYVAKLKVIGKSKVGTQEKYVRELDIQVGINPWGYKDGVPITVANGNIEIKVDKSEAYASPQWTSALASSGDIIVKGGVVTVNGDIYVNGKTPEPSGTVSLDGTNYGGLVVGKDGQLGKLVVNGNIFSTSYVHTAYPGSTIEVNGRTDVTNYDELVSKIYGYGVDSPYVERATNLNHPPANDGNPLGFALNDAAVSSLGAKQTNESYIDYLKYAYKLQKEAGGFVYANSIQVEKHPDDFVTPSPQSITIKGSAIIYDNLEIDSKGDINIGHNFYGFKTGSSVSGTEYNKSSSIITNHADGKIAIGKRVYAGGVAYVTAFDNSVPPKPYKTGEAISLYKNFYAYRIMLPGEESNSNISTKIYAPFKFLEFADLKDKFNHVINYNTQFPSGLTIGNGGNVYDKDLIKLNGTLEENSSIKIYGSMTGGDMGFSEGILMGSTGPSSYFIGNVKNEGSTPATKSLLRDAFDHYIRDKYTTLMEVKSLKSDTGDVVTINELTTTGSAPGQSYLEGQSHMVYSDTSSENFIAVEGNVLVKGSGSNITISRYALADTSLTTVLGSPVTVNGNTYTGIIFATGKVVIDGDAGSTININGAVISGKYVEQPTPLNTTNTEGIVFTGAGVKNIKYDKKVLLKIFKLTSSEALGVKKLLTSERGIVEMFNKMYTNNKIANFRSSINALSIPNITTPEEKLLYIANKYEITDDPALSDYTVLHASVISSSTSGVSNKNYRILSWKTVK